MATTEAIDVVMPQMGVSVSEGTITKWLKAQGDQVEADEPLLEISTDKVDTEVPSPGSGVLSEILVQEGQTVDVGTKLAVIGADGASAQPAQQDAPPEPATAEAAAEAEAPSSAESPAPTAPAQQEQEEQEPAQAAQAAQSNGKTFVSPVVAKIASEHGVDPSQVQGTGRGGRVTKKDILNFIESGAEAAPAAPPQPAAPAQPTAPAQPEPAAAPQGAAPPPPKPSPAPAPAAAQPG